MPFKKCPLDAVLPPDGDVHTPSENGENVLIYFYRTMKNRMVIKYT